MPGNKRQPMRRGRKKTYKGRRNVWRKQKTGFLKIVRWHYPNSIGGSDTVPAGGLSYTFSLGDLPNFSEFTNLFEVYQIAAVAVRFVLRRSPDHATTVGNRGFNIRFMMARDHTDSTVPANYAELQQKQGTRDFYLTEDRPMTKWMFIKTNTIDVGYTTAVASNYGVNYNRWIDTTNTSTPYYGLKIFYDALYAGLQIQPEFKYYIRVKDVK